MTEKEKRFSRFCKKAFDRGLAGLCLLLALPVMMIVAVAVRTSLGRPILYRQQRPGLAGRPFVICKFRTMTDACGADGDRLPDAQRLTRFGRFLRATSMDELPQLFNVLKGDMSFVGPRPLLMEYLPLYSPEQMRRHCVKPGMTGWAQVNGRNVTKWGERFELDLWYVDHWSLRLDALILLKTLLIVVNSRQVSAVDHATMPRFSGNPRGFNHE